MTTLVRTDRTSGYKWVDFYVDQSARWQETITWWPGAQNVGTPVNVTGYGARLVIIRADRDLTVAFDLTSPADITVGDVAGTFTWDIPAGQMETLIRPVYQHELTLIPNGDDDLAFPLLKGRVLVRPSIVPPVLPSTGVGWGHGPWGHFPWGH